MRSHSLTSGYCWLTAQMQQKIKTNIKLLRTGQRKDEWNCKEKLKFNYMLFSNICLLNVLKCQSLWVCKRIPFSLCVVCCLLFLSEFQGSSLGLDAATAFLCPCVCVCVGGGGQTAPKTHPKRCTYCTYRLIPDTAHAHPQNRYNYRY